MISHKKELIVGLFVLFGMALMSIMVIQYGRMGDGLEDSYQIIVEYEDATGVIKGSEVRMGGAVIGQTMTRPALNEDSDGVRVELRIRGDIRIEEESVFQIASLNFLGDRFIEIRPPLVRKGKYLQDGAVVQGKSEGGLAAIQQQAEDISDQAVKTMTKIDESLGKVDGLLEEVRAATGHIASISMKVDERVLSEENLEHISRSLASVEKSMAEIEEASELLAPMMKKADGTLDETRLAVGETREAIAAAKKTIETTNQSLEGLGPVFEEIPATLKDFRVALAKAGAALDGVSEGKGLLGALTKDDKIRSDAKEFLSNLRRYGILRYRDPEEEDEELPDFPRTRRR